MGTPPLCVCECYTHVCSGHSISHNSLIAQKVLALTSDGPEMIPPSFFHFLRMEGFRPAKYVPAITQIGHQMAPLVAFQASGLIGLGQAE